MDANEIKLKAQKSLQSEVDDLGATFGSNSGISESGLTLTDGMDLTIPAETGPRAACMSSEKEDKGVKTQVKTGYFTYATHSGRISKGSLFDGLRCLPWSVAANDAQVVAFNDPEVVKPEHKGKQLFLVPWSHLGKRCQVTLPYETITVTVKVSSGKEQQLLLPYFPKEVHLKAKAEPSLVPVFGYASQMRGEVKCAVCELNKDYCVITQ